MRQDLRFAVRMIAAHRWFSAAVVFTLALGIGLNTMVFTLLNAALFKPVPVPRGERLVAIGILGLSNSSRASLVSYPDFRDYRAHGSAAAGSALEQIEAESNGSAILSDSVSSPQHYRMGLVSSGLFRMLRTPPIQGRDFTADEEKPGAAAVILLGYSIWKNRYGGKDDVTGRVIRVDGKPATIIGVMPEGFQFPEQQEVWMPLAATAEREDRANRPLQVFGMLRPGFSIAQAGADLDVISRRLEADYPQSNKGTRAIVQTFHQRYNGDQIQIVFSLMMAAVVFVLLIACANVANMMLSRSLERRREISIRAALGASRWQVVRQLLMESLLLSLLGGALGLALSAAGVHAFDLGTRDVGKPYWVQFTMEYAVFGYFAATCVLSALLFGLVPALRSSRTDVNTALKDGARTAGTQRGGRLSGVLVVFQFALTMVLLVGAGVFLRTLVEKQSLNSWLPSGQILTARITLPKERYPDDASRRRFFDQLLAKLSATAGVSSAALVSDLPGNGAGTRKIEIEEKPLSDPAHGPSATVLVQSPGFFRTIALPLVRGRDFKPTEGLRDQAVAVVTTEFARHHWQKQDAIGKRLRFYENGKPGEWIEVVGVSADMEQHPVEASADSLMFLPYRRNSWDSMDLLLRTDSNPLGLLPAVRTAVRDLDQDLPLFEVNTLAEAVNRQFWFLRLFGSVFLVFALVALVIASVGIYAVMAQATGRRTQEIGVRMALGATSRSILRLVLRRGAIQLLAGLAAGLAAAFPAARLLQSLTFLTTPSDPILIACVGLLLALVGLFACWLPARRAAELNPVNAIRNE